MKFYISFGQVHTHSVNGQTIDKDCIVEISEPSMIEARKRAFKLFGRKFFTVYNHAPDMEYYPRGIIKI